MIYQCFHFLAGFRVAFSAYFTSTKSKAEEQSLNWPAEENIEATVWVVSLNEHMQNQHANMLNCVLNDYILILI